MSQLRFQLRSAASAHSCTQWMNVARVPFCFLQRRMIVSGEGSFPHDTSIIDNMVRFNLPPDETMACSVVK